MNQPIRIIIETGKEYREGQKFRAREANKRFLLSVITFILGFGSICYLFLNG